MFPCLSGTRKVHYKFNDDEEMAEEYNMQTDVLVRRAWRRKNTLKKDGEWEVELGDPEPAAMRDLGANVGIIESSSQVGWIDHYSITKH